MSVSHLWESLLANFAILAVLVLAWSHFQPAVSRWPRLAQNAGFGLLMGAGAMLAMRFTVELHTGLYFDLRTVAVALAGLFAGPVGALVALALASIQRVAIGGDGVLAGIIAMAIIGALAVAGYFFRRGRPATPSHVIVFGVVVSLASTAGVAYGLVRFWPEQLIPVTAALSIVAFASFVFGGAFLVQEARQRKLREDFAQSQAVFSHALAEMSDGIAMFDKDKRLVFSNEQYLAFFPRTRDLRRPGASFTDILRGVVESGEQLGRPQSDSAAWIEETSALLGSAGEEEVQLFDGRWLGIRTRPAADGSCMVVVSDLTRHKKDQRALREMTERLQLLASTDGLTGIGNRRAFDTAFAREADIAARTLKPLSLLLVDIDWFKSFNDEYGHLTGDRCLRAVAHALHAAVSDRTGLVARFGGEEFVVLLPGLDEAEAVALSEAFARVLHARAIEHSGSPKGIVTASVGVASWTPVDGVPAISDLLRNADVALYRAKSSGRDRICTPLWGQDAVAGAA